MNWSTLRGALYAQGTTLYRITPFGLWFLLDAWSSEFAGWALLATAASLDVAQQFAECEEVYQSIGVT